MATVLVMTTAVTVTLDETQTTPTKKSSKRQRAKRKLSHNSSEGSSDSFARHTKKVLSRGTSAQIEEWLLTYPIFTSSTSWPSRELFRLWEKRYGKYLRIAEQDNLEPEKRELVNAHLTRLCYFVALWIRLHPRDFSPRQMAAVIRLICQRDQALTNEIKLLMLRSRPPTLTLRSCQDAATSSVRMTLSRKLSIDSGTIRGSLLGRSAPLVLDFMTIPEAALARELTLIEWQLFQDVNLRSLLTVKNHEGDSLFEPIINQYKLISNWVATKILTAENTELQVQVLEKFIRLASQCLQLNNFNTFMEIVSGLNHNSMQRLKGLWAQLSEKAREQWRAMDSLMSPQHNFRHYRRELKQRKLPVLPYFGIYLRDFTFINDGNSRYKANGSINQKYVHLLHERAKEVYNFQRVPYNLGTASTAIQDFISLLPGQVIHDEDCLYALSLQSQPSLWLDTAREQLSESDSEHTTTSMSLTDSGPYRARTDSVASADMSEETCDDDATHDEPTTEEGLTDRAYLQPPRSPKRNSRRAQSRVRLTEPRGYSSDDDLPNRKSTPASEEEDDPSGLRSTSVCPSPTSLSHQTMRDPDRDAISKKRTDSSKLRRKSGSSINQSSLL